MTMSSLVAFPSAPLAVGANSMSQSVVHRAVMSPIFLPDESFTGETTLEFPVSVAR